jgi:hypothetical protein
VIKEAHAELLQSRYRVGIGKLLGISRKYQPWAEPKAMQEGAF